MKNVYIDNSTIGGWEKGVIEYFKKKNIWKKVVYNPDNPKDNTTEKFEDKMMQLTSIEYMPYDLYDKMYNHLYVFMDMYCRNSSLGQYSYDIKTIHDYLNIFNLALNYYYSIFKNNEIDLYITQRSPHIGLDYLKLMLAKEMGIKTLILEQTLFANRFFYYWDYYDYGFFETSLPLFEKEEVHIEEKYEKDLFYMQESAFSIKKSLVKHFPSLRYLRFIFSPSKADVALYNFYQSRKQQKYKLESNEEVDFGLKYVYFALHLQPEKTTSGWGGKFNDQLLALEKLSNMIPEDWLIYVKENPKQRAFMRGQWYYKRLSLIPKIKIVPQTTNTYKLLSRSQFVSTITGTVGWEAITGGKNVLAFGWGTWYKGFPGVYMYTPDLDIETIVNNKIDHQLVEEKLSQLKMKMGHGVIYREYYEMVENFSEKSNVDYIISSLLKILNETDFIKD